jgi:hypothetical protein
MRAGTFITQATDMRSAMIAIPFKTSNYTYPTCSRNVTQADGSVKVSLSTALDNGILLLITRILIKAVNCVDGNQTKN